MKYGEKFKDPEQRCEEFRKFTNIGPTGVVDPMAVFAWLETEVPPELLPCPFCGYKHVDTISVRLDDGSYVFQARCRGDGCKMIGPMGDSREEAARRFNAVAKAVIEHNGGRVELPF